MSEANDRALVEKCLAGDTRAFEDLVEGYQKVLYNVALRMLNNREDAMDVTQNAFIKAYERLDTYNPKYKFFSWIYKIMVNESLNTIRRRKPQTEVHHTIASSEKTPDESNSENWTMQRVQSAIIQLPIEYRRLVVLRHFGNLSYRDMSGALDIPEKTIKSRLYSARQMLKDILIKRGVVRT